MGFPFCPAWRRFLFHPRRQWWDEVSVSTRVWLQVDSKRSEQAQNQVWGGKSRGVTPLVKLAVELPQHAEDKLLQCLEEADVDVNINTAPWPIYARYMRTPVTWGLQCSSIQLKTQADSSWKLLTETELLKDWNKESMMLWKMLNLIWSDTWFSPCCGLFWWAFTMCS